MRLGDVQRTGTDRPGARERFGRGEIGGQRTAGGITADRGRLREHRARRRPDRVLVEGEARLPSGATRDRAGRRAWWTGPAGGRGCGRRRAPRGRRRRCSAHPAARARDRGVRCSSVASRSTASRNTVPARPPGAGHSARASAAPFRLRPNPSPFVTAPSSGSTEGSPIQSTRNAPSVRPPDDCPIHASCSCQSLPGRRHEPPSASPSTPGTGARRPRAATTAATCLQPNTTVRSSSTNAATPRPTAIDSAERGGNEKPTGEGHRQVGRETAGKPRERERRGDEQPRASGPYEPVAGRGDQGQRGRDQESPRQPARARRTGVEAHHVGERQRRARQQAERRTVGVQQRERPGHEQDERDERARDRRGRDPERAANVAEQRGADHGDRTDEERDEERGRPERGHDCDERADSGNAAPIAAPDRIGNRPHVADRGGEARDDERRQRVQHERARAAPLRAGCAAAGWRRTRRGRRSAGNGDADVGRSDR